jgi:hypothetical protein
MSPGEDGSETIDEIALMRALEAEISADCLDEDEMAGDLGLGFDPSSYAGRHDDSSNNEDGGSGDDNDDDDDDEAGLKEKHAMMAMLSRSMASLQNIDSAVDDDDDDDDSAPSGMPRELVRAFRRVSVSVIATGDGGASL